MSIVPDLFCGNYNKVIYLLMTWLLHPHLKGKTTKEWNLSALSSWLHHHWSSLVAWCLIAPHDFFLPPGETYIMVGIKIVFLSGENKFARWNFSVTGEEEYITGTKTIIMSCSGFTLGYVYLLLVDYTYKSFYCNSQLLLEIKLSSWCWSRCSFYMAHPIQIFFALPHQVWLWQTFTFW